MLRETVEEQLNRSLARVFRDELPVGAGLLVGRDVVLTCAHVVCAAWGGTTPELGCVVELDFPLIASERVGGTVIHLGEEGLDLACLRLCSPPSGVTGVRLVDADQSTGNRVRAFGFPDQRPRGVWSTATVLGRTAEGRIQLEDERNHGLPMSRGFSGGPIIDIELGAVIAMTVEVESRAERRTAYALTAGTLYDDWPELAELAPQSSPFRGLEAFQPEDAEVFFGRDRLVDDLLGQLERTGVVTVAGPSGCGKSSLALAGMAARLAGESVRAIVLRPGTGSSPWHALAGVLLDWLVDSPDLDSLDDLARRLSETGVEDVINRLLVRHNLRRLTLIVDQLDEPLEQVPGEIGDVLVALLDTQATHCRTPRFDLVIVANSRSVERLLSDQRLSHLGGSTSHVGVVSQDELREAIEKPMASPGMPVYQDGLVEVLLKDVAQERNPFPLLQFTLTLLWEQQQFGVLTHDAYEALGRIEGVVAGYAERVWSDLGEEERKTTRRLLCQLVSPTEPEGFVRRSVLLTNLDEDQVNVARMLAGTRLLTVWQSADTTEAVELVHETLVWYWIRLRDWVEFDREFRAWQDALSHQARRWHEQREKALLLRGSTLRLARRMLSDRVDNLLPAEREFIHASRVGFLRRLILRTLVVEAVVSLVVILGWVYIVDRQQQAQEQALSAASAVLQRASPTSPREAAELTMRAYLTHDDLLTRQQLFTQFEQLRFAETVLDGTAQDRSVNRAGSRVLAQDNSGLLVWDLTTPRARPVRLLGSTLSAASQSVWINDEFVAAGTGAETTVWNARTGEVVRKLPVSGNTLWADPTGRWLGSGAVATPPSAQFTLTDLHNPDSPAQVLTLPASLDDPSYLAPSVGARVAAILPSGELVLDQDGRVFAFSARGSRPLPARAPLKVVDMGSGEPLVSECVDGPRVRLRGLVSGQVVAEHQYSSRYDTCDQDVTFSTDMRTIARTSPQGNSVAISIEGSGNAAPRTFTAPPNYTVSRLVPEPDGSWRVVLEAATSVIVVRLPALDPLDHALATATSNVPLPDRDAMVLLSPDREVEVWDVRTRHRIAHQPFGMAAPPPDPVDTVNLAVSPDHQLVTVTVTVSASAAVRTWRLPDLTPVGGFDAPVLPVRYGDSGTAVMFLDARRALVSARDTVSTWDMINDRKLTGPFQIPGNVWTGAYFDAVYIAQRDELLVPARGTDTSWLRYRLADGAEMPGSRIELGDGGVTTGDGQTKTVDPSGRLLATYWGAGVEVWDLDTRQRVDRLPIAQGTSVSALRFRDPNELEVSLSYDPYSPSATLVMLWNRNRLWGIPKLFGQNSSATRTVPEQPYALPPDFHSSDPDKLAPVNPSQWIGTLCRALQNGPAELQPPGLPPGSWTGPVCDHM